jgi:hypothetical protein
MHHLPGIISLKYLQHTRGVAVLDSISNLFSFLAYRFLRTLPQPVFLHLHETLVNMHKHVLEHVLDGVS